MLRKRPVTCHQFVQVCIKGVCMGTCTQMHFICLSVSASCHTNFEPHVCLCLLQKQEPPMKQRR